ncbi:MAG: type II toxin-antitoxin system VapB family antitoxin [Chloroflexota bacterium]|nr:type II toxin-antitoxin system VapB family antitoxin [Chloroflexota bacterium]
MRTNVVLDDELVAEAMRLTGIKTKRQVIDEALRTLVRIKRQRELLTLEGAVHWEGDLDEMRTSRFIADDDDKVDYDVDAD